MDSKYFDSLGNELYPLIKDDTFNFYTNKKYNAFVYTTINPLIDKSSFYKKIIESNVKPISTWSVQRKATNEQTFTFNFVNYPVAKTESDEIITNTLIYKVRHDPNNYYITGSINASNSYNENTQIVNDTPIWQGAVDKRVEILYFKQMGILVLDVDYNILGIVYMIIGYDILTDGTISNAQNLSANNISSFGGMETTWNDIHILPLSYKAKEFDNSNNTVSGGGFGTGVNYTDSVSIPSLPNLNINAAGSSLYNLTNAQMLAFTSYLWSSDWQDNIKKLRNDTMQNIIGVSVTDIALTGNATSIKLGNLNTEVSANLINNWVSVDCGEIELNEYYGSFADYEPYIALTLYLPKVGFVQIPADTVVNNIIKVVYNIELCSGEGICFVYITNKRDGFSYVYNTYTCHVTSNVALSASDHTQQLSALINAGINTTTAIAGAIASGGTTVGSAAMTVATSALDVATTKNPTVTTGNIGNMSSMMCVKKPYLMINRTNLTKPSSFRENNGQLINYTAKISGHTGFLKTRDFHAEFDAPYSHKVEIERIMNEGVFING